MKYVKKPIVVDAIEWTPDQRSEADPKWMTDAIDRGEVVFNEFGFTNMSMTIYTLEGPMKASQGDYIIQGVKGELYPCKPDIFEATYSPVE